jgi:hypothetical protein
VVVPAGELHQAHQDRREQEPDDQDADQLADVRGIGVEHAREVEERRHRDRHRHRHPIAVPAPRPPHGQKEDEQRQARRPEGVDDHATRVGDLA